MKSSGSGKVILLISLVVAIAIVVAIVIFGGEKTGRAARIVPQTPARAGIFRNGIWVLDRRGDHQFAIDQEAPTFGAGIDGIPVPGDWNGDGKTELGIYRKSDGIFLLDDDGDGKLGEQDRQVDLGVGHRPGDVPVVGDWNGDGRSDLGLVREGYLWILDSDGNGKFEESTDKSCAYGGVAGDLPVVGDWSGDGRAKIGLVRNGYLWLLDADGSCSFDSTESGKDVSFAFGAAGDVPVAGDWNGTGRAQAGVFRQGFLWVLDGNGDRKFEGAAPSGDLSFPFGGIAGDVPVTGRW